MSILNKLFTHVSIQSVDSFDDSINFLNPDNLNKYVSAEEALKNSDIYSLIFQLSSDLASSKLLADQPRNQAILDNPSATASQHAFWQSMYAQLLLGGEAFAYRWRNQNGTDLRWEYLRPSQVSPFLLEDGSGLIYNVNFDEPKVGLQEGIPQADMIHLRLLSQNGGMTGISPLASLSNELNIRNASNQLLIKALNQSVLSTGVLKINREGLLNNKIKEARSRTVMKQMQSGRPLVLDQLEDYTPLEVKGNVAQLLSQTDWTRKQIAKVYGINDSVLNGKGDQQSSLQMEDSSYGKSLMRFANPIVSELNNKLSANIKMNVRKAVDPFGDTFATLMSGLTKDGTLAGNQTVSALKQAGYLPDSLPDPINTNPTTKGGEN